MSTGGQKRTRLERVAAIELPPNLTERLLENLQRVDVLVRLGLCLVAAVALWLIVGGWAPPFAYRTGYVPPRDMYPRVEFKQYNAQDTETNRRIAANQARNVYKQDPSTLLQIKADLRHRLSELSKAEKLDDLSKGLWQEFSPPPMANVETPTEKEQEQAFKQFRDFLAEEGNLAKIDEVLNKAFAPLEQNGILDQKPEVGNQSEIFVHPTGQAGFSQVVPISDVLLSEAASKLNDRLRKELKEKDLDSHELPQRLFQWIKPRLKKTLTPDDEGTKREQRLAAESVPEVFITHSPGRLVEAKPLARANQPLTPADVSLLRLEHEAYLASLSAKDRIARSLAVFGMILAVYTLTGFYVVYREPSMLRSLYRFSMMLAMFVGAVGLAKMASVDAWRAESIPVILFGMTVAIVYHQEVALLLTAALSLVVVITLGENLADYITLMSAAATSILLLGSIRTRSKLIYVGILSAIVAMLTDIGVTTLTVEKTYDEVWRVGLWAVVAGFLMLGLLPFVEKMFGVLTDMSLLEIGDPSHPLLQELVRRAPGTYNHSINVASIGEAAADAIGARGLLVRVGAYFHDIGKMLKPQYFAENQGQGASLHESLLPAMSRLIIVAHVKDGADLARQHGLPLPIIAFIEQHHGTTLVEYFYRRAAQQSESDPNRGVVEEHSYRYPGPKPQSKETGVLMLADAVESASRTLVEPTPSRLESLVHDIAMKRLLDGQFDQCGMTLQELNTVEESLVKSLTAVYHGRVRYPEQRTA